MNDKFKIKAADRLVANKSVNKINGQKLVQSAKRFVKQNPQLIEKLKNV
jgi:hypothetical protein